jgi:hypothetical protein
VLSLMCMGVGACCPHTHAVADTPARGGGSAAHCLGGSAGRAARSADCCGDSATAATTPSREALPAHHARAARRWQPKWVLKSLLTRVY